MHNEEFRNLESSRKIISIIRSGTMVWVQHVVGMERIEIRRNVRRKTRKSRDHLEHLGLDWMIILKWVCKKYDATLLAGLMWLRIQTRSNLGRMV